MRYKNCIGYCFQSYIILIWPLYSSEIFPTLWTFALAGVTPKLPGKDWEKCVFHSHSMSKPAAFPAPSCSLALFIRSSPLLLSICWAPGCRDIKLPVWPGVGSANITHASQVNFGVFLAFLVQQIYISKSDQATTNWCNIGNTFFRGKRRNQHRTESLFHEELGGCFQCLLGNKLLPASGCVSPKMLLNHQF